MTSRLQRIPSCVDSLFCHRRHRLISPPRITRQDRILTQVSRLTARNTNMFLGHQDDQVPCAPLPISVPFSVPGSGRVGRVDPNFAEQVPVSLRENLLRRDGCQFCQVRFVSNQCLSVNAIPVVARLLAH